MECLFITSIVRLLCGTIFPIRFWSLPQFRLISFSAREARHQALLLLWLRASLHSDNICSFSGWRSFCSASTGDQSLLLFRIMTAMISSWLFVLCGVPGYFVEVSSFAREERNRVPCLHLGHRVSPGGFPSFLLQVSLSW
jgi:hypothetical protein